LLARLRRSLLERLLSAEPAGAEALDRRSPVPLVPLVPLGSEAQVQVGYAFRSDWFAAHGVRLLRGVNIAPGALSWAYTAYLPETTAARYAAYALRAGDVVIGLDRPLSAAGLRVARLGAADLPALLVQRVGRILPDADRLDGEYLLLCLQSESAVCHLAAHATGTQLPHISPTDLKTVRLPLPPLLRQRLIVAKTRAAWQRVAGAAAQATAARSRLDELWQRLLRRAFSGALDQSERADPVQPAPELLAGDGAGLRP
ncbi:MAG TPA: restriction endonuclease subunit S, partial [Pseudomonadota bacterium]|nr:restriction endonuclease subunit S [Pseudomonadota bacterium]